MDVSVIIPFYNNSDWLYDAVNSIKESGNLSYEIIIVDDGSLENIDINQMSDHRTHIKIIRQENQGPGKARNRGISEAKGKYIAFLDSDDLFIENKLSNQLEFMEKNNYMWSHTSYIKFYDEGHEEVVNNKNFYGEVFPKCLAFNPIATPTVMVKRCALENPTKRFSDKMRFGQDGFLWCQLAAYHYIGVVEEPLSKVRMRGGNATLMAKNHLYVKAHMYEYMKKSEFFFNNNNIPRYLMTVFGIANINYQLVDRVFSRFLKPDYIEYLSRVLYSTQYLALKLYGKKSTKN